MQGMAQLKKRAAQTIYVEAWFKQEGLVAVQKIN
jgi:hypothetical protein